jgi:hypothetical protein
MTESWRTFQLSCFASLIYYTEYWLPSPNVFVTDWNYMNLILILYINYVREKYVRKTCWNEMRSYSLIVYRVVV